MYIPNVGNMVQFLMEVELCLKKVKKIFLAKYFFLQIWTSTCTVANIDYFEINLQQFFFEVGQN